MVLSRQALLSTAELIKCVELGATDVSTDEKLMSALVANDYTISDSIAFEMLQAEQRIPVTIAVANLYLRKQIIFEHKIAKGRCRRLLAASFYYLLHHT